MNLWDFFSFCRFHKHVPLLPFGTMRMPRYFYSPAHCDFFTTLCIVCLLRIHFMFRTQKNHIMIDFFFAALFKSMRRTQREIINKPFDLFNVRESTEVLVRLSSVFHRICFFTLL